MSGFTPDVSFAVQHDLSRPLSELAAEAPASIHDRLLEAAPLLELPKTQAAENQILQPSQRARSAPVQTSPGAAAMPAPQANFDGISNRNGAIPPDPSGDIGVDSSTGKRYYFQWVNLSYQAWDVTDPANPVSILGPLNGNQLWSGFGGPCQTTNWGDPIVLFDSLAGRWFVSQFSINGPFYQCIAVSQTANPAGAWHRYAFYYDSVKMNDYPKFGVWPDGYYMTVNQFRLSSKSWEWAGQGVVVFERSKMLAGLPARQVKYDLFDVNYNYGGLLPSDIDGLRLPPDGAPNPFIAWDDGSWYGGQDALRVWNFHVDWDNTALSTFGIVGNPNLIIPSAEVTPRLTKIPQPNTSIELDPIGDRLMYRSQYRNFGAYQSIVSNHTIDVSGKAGLHWFELRYGNGDWEIYQQGVYAPDEHSRWMASTAKDGAGNLAIGFSMSSGTQLPQIRYTGRLEADPLGILTQQEQILVTSTGSQTGYLPAAERWGDYSMMSIDPADDCTFWYTQEYTSGGMSWKTRIASFRYDTCTASEFGYLTGQVTGTASGLPLSGVVIGMPGYQTASGADGSYRLALAPGDYTISFSKNGYLTKTELVTITSGAELALDEVLELASDVVVQGTVTDGGGHAGLPLYARLDISGYSGGPVFTDPLTGFYQITLSELTSYDLVVTALSGGYLAANQNLTTPAAQPVDPDVTLDFQLLPNPESCAPAPGYAMTAGFIERFSDRATPGGWQVLDYANANLTWQFNNPTGAFNETGGSGLFAGITDVNKIGNGFNSGLISPLLDFSSDASVVLSFRSDIDNFESTMVTIIDVSGDGGQTWTQVWKLQVSDPGPKQYAAIDLTEWAAGKAEVRLRFRASASANSLYAHSWQVDDVQVNDLPLCITQPGALLMGQVTDGNTGLGLADAELTAGSESAASQATPLDPALPDGFYQLWVPQGITTVSAGLNLYAPVNKPVSLQADSVNWLSVVLPAGKLVFHTASHDSSLVPNASDSIEAELFNDGGSQAAFNLAVMEGVPPLQPQPTGPFAGSTRLLSPKRLHELDASHLYSPGQPAVPDWPGVSLLRSFDSGQARTWGLAPLPDGSLWIGAANRLELNRYSPAGQPESTSASQLPWVGVFGADLAYQPLTGRLWQVNVGGDNCIYELDADSGIWTRNKICPSLGSSQRGLAFDPLTGTYYSGSWTDGIVNHFDASGQLLDSLSTGLNLAGLAYHPVSQHLYALVNAADGADVYVLDAANGYRVLGGFQIAGMTNFGQSGLEFAPDGHLWALDGGTGQVFELAVGEPRADAWNGVSWLDVQPGSGSIAAGSSRSLVVNINTTGLLPGAYQAYIQVTHDTPYPVAPFIFNLTVLDNGQSVYYLPVMFR